MRAWRSLERFEGRASLRTWLYRVATNVCLDLLRGRRRRALPMDVSEPGTATAPRWGPPPRRGAGSKPIAGPTGHAQPFCADPGEIRRRSGDEIRLTFVAALQGCSPPRQRAVLILRDVLRWKGRGGRLAPGRERRWRSGELSLQRARAAAMAAEPLRGPQRARADARAALDRVPRRVAFARRRRARRPPPRGRDRLDAAVRPLAPGPRGDPGLPARPRRGVRRVPG